MTIDDVLDQFRACDAYWEGHFILTSGRHSDTYLQKSLLFSRPEIASKLCNALAKKLEAAFGKIDVVASPALGGIIPGYETARALGARAIFCERNSEGVLEFRRGFEVKPTEKIVIVEDIVSTGLSFRETVEALGALNAHLLGGGCVLDRSDGTADVGCQLVSLAAKSFMSWESNDLPEHLKTKPAIKPGSRRSA